MLHSRRKAEIEIISSGTDAVLSASQVSDTQTRAGSGSLLAEYLVRKINSSITKLNSASNMFIKVEDE